MMDMAITMPQVSQAPQGNAQQAPATDESAVDFGTLLTQAQEPRQTEEATAGGNTEKAPAAPRRFRDKPADTDGDDALLQAQFAAWQNIVLPVEVMLANENGEVNPTQLLAALAGVEDETANGPDVDALLQSLVEAEEPEVYVDPETGEVIEIPETKLETALLEKPILDEIPGQPVEAEVPEAPVAEVQPVAEAPAQAEANPDAKPMARPEEIQPQETEQPALQDATAVAPRQATTPYVPFVQQELDVEAPRFTQMVAQAVEQKTDAGVTQFDIALYPKELGKVTVNVQIMEGQATLSFICENAKAQTILNAHAGAIGSLIEQNTGRETVVEVPRQETAGQQSYEGHGGNQQQQQTKPQHPRKEQVNFFIDQLKSSMLVG